MTTYQLISLRNIATDPFKHFNKTAIRVLPAAPNAKNPFLNDDVGDVDDAKNDNIQAIIALNNHLNNNYNPYNQNVVNGAHTLPTQKFTGTNFPTNPSLSHHASPAKPPRPGPPARPPPPSATVSSTGHDELSSAPSFTADFAHANIPPPKPLPPITGQVKSAFDDLEDTMRMALGSPSKGGGGTCVGGQSMFVSSTVVGGGQQPHFHQQQSLQQQQQQQMFSSNTMQQQSFVIGGLVSFVYLFIHILSLSSLTK